MIYQRLLISNAKFGFIEGISAECAKASYFYGVKNSMPPQSQLVSLKKTPDNKIIFKALKDEDEPFKIEMDIDGKILSRLK